LNIFETLVVINQLVRFNKSVLTLLKISELVFVVITMLLTSS